MSYTWEYTLAGGALLVSLLVTGAVRRYAMRQRLLDVPNERSSHAVPTPRGGGIAIAVAMLLALPLLGVLGVLRWPQVGGIAGGGTLVTVVGYADDHFNLAARWRLLGHFSAAVWLLVWIGGMPPIHVFGSTRDLGWPGHLLAALYLVWLLNLTNFMDGIDGLASVETVTVCLAAAFLSLHMTPRAPQWLAPIILSSATLGFLAWNWHPAKIFMGDAGSGFLGFMMGSFSICAAWSSPRLLWAWLILLGVFVVDATLTLFRRMARRERVYEAHRTHAYQHAAQRWGSHSRVTVSVGVLNVLWLFPVAMLVASGRLDGLAGVLIAYAPLVAIALRLGAGKPFVR